MGGTPDVLATVDNTSQTTTAGSALTFNATPLVTGNAITHTAGSTDVGINQPGIYQASFHSTVSANTGGSIPASVMVRLFQGGTPVTGAVASHTFTASSEVSTISFNVPFQVTNAPTTVQVVPENAGFTFADSALTVIRLGDTP